MPSLPGDGPRRVPFSHSTVAMFAAVDARRDALARATRAGSTMQDRPRDERGQLTHHLPGSGLGEGEQLSAVVNEARRARGNRKALRRPARPNRYGHAPLFGRMKFHLRKLARRALNDLSKTGQPIPSCEALADALAAYVWEQHTVLVFIREPGEGPLGLQGPRWLDGDGAVRRVAWSAARYTLEGWTPDYIQQQQARGAKGGRNSRRGPTKTTGSGLARLRELDGLTVAQLAVAMGMSESSVKRLRKQERESSRQQQEDS